MSLKITEAKDQYGDKWTASWWSPNSYQIQFTIQNTGDDTVYLGNFKWCLVSGKTPENVTISEYGRGYAGNAGTVALYDVNGNKISEDFRIEAASKPNLATGTSPSTTSLISANSGSYSQNSVYFVPRHKENVGNFEISGVPDANHDTVSKATRTIRITKDIALASKATTTVVLKPVNVPDYTVFQVSPISQAEIIPKHRVTWLPGATDATISGVSAGGNRTVLVTENDETTGPNVSRPNWKFVKWKSNTTGVSDISSMNGLTGKVTQDRQYTAIWEPDTAEVIFYRNKDSNDKVTLGKGSGTIGIAIGSGTDTINSAIKVSTGKSLNTVVSENKSTALGLNELKGYEFYHWAKNNTYNKVSASQVPPYVNLSKVTIKADSGDNTFYAIWRAKSGTVTFYRNYDASDMTVVAGGTIDNVSYATETVGSIKPENPTRPGYTFEGWSESRNGSVVANSLSLWNTSTDKARTKFYAIWSPITGPVTFYRNYDSSDMTIVDGGSKANVAYIKETLGSIKPSDPTRLGHKFIGWALTRTGGVESNNLSLWDVSANKPRTAFYAIWEKLYTVWVRVNGTWVKKLNVRRYRASSGTWEEMPPRTRSGGNWKDEWDKS